jgi:hypothetical protein
VNFKNLNFAETISPLLCLPTKGWLTKVQPSVGWQNAKGCFLYSKFSNSIIILIHEKIFYE